MERSIKENMIPVIIMNHGQFGKELIASAEMIVGKLEQTEAVSLMPGMGIEEYLAQAEAAVTRAGGKAIVLTDLYGGTPCNVALMLRQRYELKVVCGMNLPMLLELAGAREDSGDTAQLADAILSTAREGILEPAEEIEETEDDVWGGGE